MLIKITIRTGNRSNIIPAGNKNSTLAQTNVLDIQLNCEAFKLKARRKG